MLEGEAGRTDEDTNGRGAAWLHVCTRLPEAYEGAARYALAILLSPLGLEPVWLNPSDVPHDAPVLYYGRGVDEPSKAIALSFSDAAAAFFAGGPSRLPVATWEDMDEGRIPVFFHDANGRPDLVASAFFWLSGWQEYVIRERDEHGRFPFTASLQHRLGTATVPFVDAYRQWIERCLREADVPVRRQSWGGLQWAMCPTHDVDYVRKWRMGIVGREVGRSLRDSSRVRQVLRQLRTGDPFSRSLFSMIDNVRRLGGRATWFVKSGGRDQRDVSYAPDGPLMEEFVGRAAHGGFEVGLHPSYHASTDASQLQDERDRLANVTGYLPTSVRSHYLRFGLPQTLRLYEGAGFRIDSTLAFPDQEGFRFATCHPFRLYDVARRRVSNVWEVPLTFMDASLFNRQRYDPDEAIERTIELLRTCRAYGGVCVGLWHNVLEDELDYPGWGRHFVSVLETARTEGAFIGTLSEVVGGSAAAQAPSSASLRTTSA